MTAVQTRFRVEGMDCASCAAKIDTALRRLPGIEDVAVSVAGATMSVRHGSEAGPEAIARKVGSLGYRATVIGAAAADRGGVAHGHDAGHHDHGDHTHDHGDHEHHDHDGHAHDHHGHEHAGPELHSHGVPADGRWWASSKGRLTLAAGAALALAWAVGKLVPAVAPWAFPIAMLVGLVPIARRAAMASVNGSPFTIESLMTVAAVGAVVIGAGEEAATVVFLFLVGELLEGVAAGKARAGIAGLAALVPRTALVEADGVLREVPAQDLAPGAVVLVRPGERIPADGEVTAGESAVDEAPVTGESTPVGKAPGDRVFAGTVNGTAALRIAVTAAAADNTIARVVRLVEEAQETKAPTERFIDRFARFYTPGVLAAGFLVAVLPPLLAGGDWAGWIYKGLAVLLIGCPCALVISTPAAIASGLSAGARRGLLMKGGVVLETLARVTDIAFDKTGTLTAGRPRLTGLVALGRSETDVLVLAAALEAGSSHPLAEAVLAEAAARSLPVRPAAEAAAVGGKGVAGRLDGVDLFLGSPRAAAERLGWLAPPPDVAVPLERLEAEGNTVSVLLADGVPAGLIAFADKARPDALPALQALRRRGMGLVMLTGDNRRTAEAIGRTLGIEPRAELLPEDKLRIVDDLRRQGRVVAKVGDGINDAPALAAADVGIAMGGGTDVALETADAALLRGRIGDVDAMLDLARRTMANIHQNIAIALGLKAVFLVTTVAGITGLWPAILADTGATVLVTANAMRLLRLGRA
ncbi:heavy metal translocating P-type ATPase [Labrys wisconsinensis]|uniref:P-type Zn(2+) transporter n=1 Tax=Labrys wisconsinensis TaxID=425677 RepID=A0ABU0J5B1_9HYPH|nr:heavy metal translocating P-type ATPase [Labrys wisconsinensis]MDQ0469448.1 Cd2+/Zn2+-exporting ATPase [Labrys wisconsinensis]